MTFRGEPSLEPVYSSVLHPSRAHSGLVWASRSAEDTDVLTTPGRNSQRRGVRLPCHSSVRGETNAEHLFF